jgi:hypothetical protein
MYIEYTNIKLVYISSPTQLNTCPHYCHILPSSRFALAVAWSSFIFGKFRLILLFFVALLFFRTVKPSVLGTSPDLLPLASITRSGLDLLDSRAVASSLNQSSCFRLLASSAAPLPLLSP